MPEWIALISVPEGSDINVIHSGKRRRSKQSSGLFAPSKWSGIEQTGKK